MIALIDGDIVSYSCAAFNEEWGWDACRDDIDGMLTRIMDTTGANEARIFISGGNNFRYQIYPEYKANRKDSVDPIYRQDANAYLVTDYGAEVTDGYEADDAIGIAATKLGSNCIICSIDKDLKQIPGNHYNWRKDEFSVVNSVDGLQSFYRSILTGDRTDNIISGLKRVGPVTAAKIINDLTNEVDMFLACQAMYNDDTRLLMNGQLLWILREENQMWRFPDIPPNETEGQV